MEALHQPKILIELLFFDTILGGRETPAKDGYRVQFAIRDDMDNSGMLTFINKNIAYPGETVRAYVKFLAFHLIEDYIFIGKRFKIREGPKVVGEGIILDITN